MHDAPNRELLLALLEALARIEELNARCVELEANINIARIFNAPPQPVSPRPRPHSPNLEQATSQFALALFRFVAAGLREAPP